MPSVICLNLDQSKILLSGNGLMINESVYLLLHVSSEKNLPFVL